MKYKKYDTPTELSNYVRYFWSIDHEDDGGKDKIIKIFADRFPRLIFQDLNGHVATKDANGIVLPESFLSGLITKQTNYQVKGSYSHVGVSFYPHAIKAIFGVDANELTDALPDLINFCTSGLIVRLQEATSHELRIAILGQFLMEKLLKQDAALLKIDPIMQSHLHYDTTISDLLLTHKISERSLERLFKHTIGISPKKYLRILRFEKTIEMLNNFDGNNLSDIAYDIGYADQSHFNKEFKDFSGFTPQTFQHKTKFGQESSSFLLK